MDTDPAVDPNPDTFTFIEMRVIMIAFATWLFGDSALVEGTKLVDRFIDETVED